MTAKEYLQSVNEKDAALRNLEKEKARLHEMLYSLGGCSGGERVQTTRNTDKFGTMYGRIDEIERTIDEKTEALLNFKFKVCEEINALSNEKHIEILYRRYIQFQTMQVIAYEMGYSYRYITKLNGKAVLEFQRKYETVLGQVEKEPQPEGGE